MFLKPNLQRLSIPRSPPPPPFFPCNGRSLQANVMRREWEEGREHFSFFSPSHLLSSPPPLMAKLTSNLFIDTGHTKKYTYSTAEPLNGHHVNIINSLCFSIDVGAYIMSMESIPTEWSGHHWLFEKKIQYFYHILGCHCTSRPTHPTKKQKKSGQ